MWIEAVVRRLVHEVMNRVDLSALDDLYAPWLGATTRRWIEPSLASFSDVHMRVLELVAEGETVVGRFTLGHTHRYLAGLSSDGTPVRNVAEVDFFRVVEGRMVRAWGLEDTHERLRQFGLHTDPGTHQQSH